MNPTVTDLKAIQALFKDKSCFVKRVFARNANGVEVNPTEESAVCWCLIGAIQRIVPADMENQERYDALRASLEKAVPADASLMDDEHDINPLVHFNDAPETTYDHIIDLIQQAIRQEEVRHVPA